MSGSLLVVGCGYLGKRIAARAMTAGWTVWGTTRHRSRTLQLVGIQPICLDWNDARTLENLPDVSHVVIAVAHDRHSRVDRYVSQVGGLQRLLDALDRGTSRPDLAYISTTGVYHQTGGVWVDETSTTRPGRDGGKAHLIAENVLRRSRGEGDWVILRLAGIYGPGRVPRAADVIAGRPIASPETGFLNLIHVDDAAASVMAAFGKRESRRRMYVVADDKPVVRGDFYRTIADMTHSPQPVFVDPAKESGVSLRSESDKRVWNRRLKIDLLTRLEFPTHREGLSNVLTASGCSQPDVPEK